MTDDVGSCWDEAPFGPGQSNGLLCELPSGHAGAHRAGDSEWMILGPEGEPSDASVRAALREWFQGIIAGGWTAEHEAKMRAALRAAGEVRP